MESKSPKRDTNRKRLTSAVDAVLATHKFGDAALLPLPPSGAAAKDKRSEKKTSDPLSPSDLLAASASSPSTEIGRDVDSSLADANGSSHAFRKGAKEGDDTGKLGKSDEPAEAAVYNGKTDGGEQMAQGHIDNDVGVLAHDLKARLMRLEDLVVSK